MGRNRLPILICLALVAGATRWWLLSLQSEPADAQLPALRADYQLQSFELWTARDDGSPEYRLRGPQLIQDASGELASIEQPQLTLFDPINGRETATLSSQSATLVSANSEVRLHGESSLEFDDRRVVTRDVLVNHALQTATTDAAARLERNQNWITGEGMTIEFLKRRVELANNISARYQSVPQ